jgi:hypothetical protein
LPPIPRFNAPRNKFHTADIPLQDFENNADMQNHRSREELDQAGYAAGSGKANDVSRPDSEPDAFIIGQYQHYFLWSSS